MSVVEGTLPSPARDVVIIGHRATATATGQKDSAKSRVHVSLVEDTVLNPAWIVVKATCATATATGQEGSASGSFSELTILRISCKLK